MVLLTGEPCLHNPLYTLLDSFSPQNPEIIRWFLAADFATLGYLIGVPLIQMDKEKPLGSMAESDKGKPKSEAG